MKILVDITHPAHVHFFKYLIRQLKKNGNIVIVTTRNKKIAKDLLVEEKIPYFKIGEYKNNIEKIVKIIPITLKLISILRFYKFGKNDWAIGIAPFHACIASLFLKNKCMGFTDTEFAPGQSLIYTFLSDYIFTPDWFPSKIYRSQHILYKGSHEYTYLTKKKFDPKYKIPTKYNLIPKKYVIIRLINWDATHDIGKHGINNIDDFINRIKRKYRPVITSEYKLPEKLKRYEYKGNLKDFHDLLYFSTGYIGEAITVAQEAIALGLPSVVINTIKSEVLRILNDEYPLFIQTSDYQVGIKKFEQMQSINEEILEKEHKKLIQDFQIIQDLMPKLLKHL